ncbi:hypothetical protein [Flavobacterium saccharophilum]|uniref:Uncharacterized protein n=1 Tax=Flavobacterium saccharophilum TaxID=29534 RepID=A0A1M7IEW6_9FLAO|nr:hypothetical protein [Flavobacterium saccharophilum]SHM39304.1 hypothetical protein SAMN05444366_3125 [Flavobacterium saccharophilum]
MVTDFSGGNGFAKYRKHIKIKQRTVKERETPVQFFKQVDILIKEEYGDLIEKVKKYSAEKESEIKIFLSEFFIKKD